MSSALTPEHREAAAKVFKALANVVIYSDGGQAVKAVDDVVRGYVDDINRTILDVLDGDMTRADAARYHKSIIRRDSLTVYLEGMRDGGIEDPEAEITDEERAIAKAWAAEQSGYVTDFWKAVDDAAKLRPAFGPQNARRDLVEAYNAARRALFARLDLWESAIRELAGQAKAAAMKNMMVTWKLGATEKHCNTCAKLNGKRKRLKWFTDNGYIPQQNDSDTLDCGGWRCLCELVDDRGRVVLPA